MFVGFFSDSVKLRADTQREDLGAALSRRRPPPHTCPVPAGSAFPRRAAGTPAPGSPRASHGHPPPHRGGGLPSYQRHLKRKEDGCHCQIRERPRNSYICPLKKINSNKEIPFPPTSPLICRCGAHANRRESRGELSGWRSSPPSRPLFNCEK